ncbi:MAG: hypothetical protein ACOCQD_05555 [archaeon]
MKENTTFPPCTFLTGAVQYILDKNKCCVERGMFMKEEDYQRVIDDIEERLKEYSELVYDIDRVVKSAYDFNVSYCYERTVATYIGDFLKEILETYGYQDVNVMNEFYLRLSKALSKEEEDEIQDEIEGEATVGKTKMIFIPDTFVNYKEDDDDKDHQLFIEYKKGDVFQYIKLATDYLKFKYYTYNSSSDNIIFMYVLINPIDEGMNPTIVHETCSSPKYQLINKNISESDFSDDTMVFIFDNCDCKVRIDSGHKLIKQAQVIDDIINEIYESETEVGFSDIINYEDNPLYKNRDKFKRNVLLANRIKYNYTNILALYETLLSNYEHINVPSDNFISIEKMKAFDEMDKAQQEDFAHKLADYFDKQIRHQTIDDEANINKFKFNYNKKRSLWILLIIQKFSNDLGLRLNFLRNLNNDEEAMSDEVLDDLNRNYRHPNHKENLNQLAMGLIVYIVKLYGMIFEMEADKIKEKKEYALFQSKKKIIKQLNKLNKLIRYRENDLEWESNLNTDGIRLSTYIINSLIQRND